MRVRGTRTYYRPSPPKMPPGLVELMEGMTKEVLRNNPTDVYGFCANHLKHLLEIRDGPPRRKPLSLEEKIALAQEKVRQRAEKRRQEYDALLLVNANINKTEEDTKHLLSQEPTNDGFNIINNQIHRVQSVLAESSEVEISHGTEIPTTNEELPNKSGKETADENSSSTTEIHAVVGHMENENDMNKIVNSDAVESNAPLIENDATEKVLNSDLTENQQTALKCNSELNIVQPSEDILNPKEKEEKSEDVDENNITELDTEIHTTSKVEPSESDKATELSMNDKELTDDHLESASINPNETVEVDTTKSDFKLLQNKEEGPQIDTNSTDPSQNEESTTRLTNKENVDTGDHEDHEDGKTLNSIDVCVNEAPSVELQSSPISESQLARDTESNHELLQQNANILDINSTEGNCKINNSENEDTDSIVTVRSVEDQQAKEMDAMDSTNNSINLSNTDHTSVRDGAESEHDTSTKFENQPVGNQETNNMDLETAAVTIQKVFRTFLFKSRASTFDDTDNCELDDDEKAKEECVFPVAATINLERRPHGLTRMDTVLQTVNEEKSLSLSTDDSSTLSSAATVIQAHVRGFLVRNKLNSNKTISTNSTLAANSTEPSLASMEMDNEQNKNKTILNIHIVPEGGNYLSRDESLITSMDLSLDGSPPSSINLHPLGSGTSERRKQLKREDAVQSISPPSNNSGKLSEDVDSVKELSITDPVSTETQIESCNSVKDDTQQHQDPDEAKIQHDAKSEDTPNSNDESPNKNDNGDPVTNTSNKKVNSDEMDVVTPYIPKEDGNASDTKLVHSGEFHDAVLPTKVSRSDASVASGE